MQSIKRALRGIFKRSKTKQKNLDILSKFSSADTTTNGDHSPSTVSNAEEVEHTQQSTHVDSAAQHEERRESSSEDGSTISDPLGDATTLPVPHEEAAVNREPGRVLAISAIVISSSSSEASVNISGLHSPQTDFTTWEEENWGSDDIPKSASTPRELPVRPTTAAKEDNKRPNSTVTNIVSSLDSPATHFAQSNYIREIADDFSTEQPEYPDPAEQNADTISVDEEDSAPKPIAFAPGMCATSGPLEDFPEGYIRP